MLKLARTSLWLQAEALTRLNRFRDARVALNSATDFVARDGKLSKLDGDVDLTRARLANASGDIALALNSYQNAHAVFVQLGDPAQSVHRAAGPRQSLRQGARFRSRDPLLP